MNELDLYKTTEEKFIFLHGVENGVRKIRDECTKYFTRSTEPKDEMGELVYMTITGETLKSITGDIFTDVNNARNNLLSEKKETQKTVIFVPPEVGDKYMKVSFIMPEDKARGLYETSTETSLVSIAMIGSNGVPNTAVNLEIDSCAMSSKEIDYACKSSETADMFRKDYESLITGEKTDKLLLEKMLLEKEIDNYKKLCGELAMKNAVLEEELRNRK